jgi:hypothetical protein
MYGKMLVVCLLFCAVAPSATLCATDSLFNYEALGAGGCTVKGLPFSGFTFSVVFANGGAVPVTAGQITVSPVDPDLEGGLNFASDGFSVSAGQSVEYQISYSVDDPPIIHGWDLQLFDPVTPPATITITSMECLGSAFSGTSCPTSSTVTNTVSDNGTTPVLRDKEYFPITRTVGVLTTIELDAHLGGSASFTSITQQAVLAPEPWPAMLTPSGLLLLVFARRLRR